MEAEDRISEIEDRMVEINESERKQEKRIKRNVYFSTCSFSPTFHFLDYIE